MAAVSLFLVVAAGYAWSTYRTLDHKLPRLAITRPHGAPSVAPPDIDGRDQNVLLIGYDSRAGLTPKQIAELQVGNDVSSSTDSMIVVHVPADGSRATLISLPRDAYVDIPGFAKNKLNAAFADGSTDDSLPSDASDDTRRAAGISLLKATVEQLTGLTIDHEILVGFAGFVTVADQLHGIPVTLCHAVDDSFARNRAAGLDGGSGFVAPAGYQVLRGAKALAFVRQRHFLQGGDLGRTARQRYFLTQAFSQFTSAGLLLDLPHLSSLIQQLEHSIWVDDGFDLTQLARQVTDLDPAHITSTVVPTGANVLADVAGTQEQVTLVDPAKVRAFVKNVVDPTPQAPTGGSTSGTPTSGTPSSGASQSGTTRQPTVSHPAAKSCIN